MSRLGRRFQELKEKGQKAFIAYLMGGDPDLNTTRLLVKEMEARGVDIVELGIPFSDPIADGVTIQKASQRALKQGVTTAAILDLVQEVRRDSEMPIVFLSYANPLLAYGLEKFAHYAQTAGLDGIIVPDLPPEEAGPFRTHLEAAGIDTIFLLAPTSSQERIELVASEASGFIYYVSLKGVTGARASLEADIGEKIKKIKSCTLTPVAVGFGISRPEQAAQVASWADGVIVGSAIVDVMEANQGKSTMVEEVGKFVEKMGKAVKRAKASGPGE